MSLVPVVEIDTWALAASLRARRKLFTEAAPWIPGPLQRIAWPVEGDEWPAAASIMRRISRLPGGENSEFGYVAFELLPPGGYVPWERTGEWRRLHLPLVTNQRCVVCCGPVMAWLPVGRLTLLGEEPHSQGNFGQTMRIHLVIDFRPRPLPRSETESPE